MRNISSGQGEGLTHEFLLELAGFQFEVKVPAFNFPRCEVEVGCGHQGALCHNDGTFKTVFQFTNIPRPRVGGYGSQRIMRKALQGAAVGKVIDSKKMMGEGSYILLAIPKWGEMNAYLI